MLSAKELFPILLNAYGEPRWWSDDPFIVMFQGVLVQNATWSGVEKTCAAIEAGLTPDYIKNLPTEELERLIRPCGFCKAKARTIQSLTAWFERYGFDRQTVGGISTERLRNELLSLRGVGAETADVILVYAFYRPSFIIDAYTRRFLSRLGFSFGDDISIKAYFEASLPLDARLYGRFHWLILEHCIACCKKKPMCAPCPFAGRCNL